MDRFPIKKEGDRLPGASHINMLTEAAKIVFGEKREWSNFRSDQRQWVIISGPEDADIESDGSESDASSVSSGENDGSQMTDCGSALYTVRPLYFDFDTNEWKTNTDEGPFCYDGVTTNNGLHIGDWVVGYYDPQRGAVVGQKLKGSCNTIPGVNFADLQISDNGEESTSTPNPVGTPDYILGIKGGCLILVPIEECD